jgi:hypothetical protein
VSLKLEYDEENAFMLRISISYKKRQAAKALAFNADELHTKLLQELDKAKIFVHAESAAATTSSNSTGAALPATAKEETTSPATTAVAGSGKSKSK